MLVSIIIPCYNEEKRIEKTLRTINHFLIEQPYSYEVIVVDNGSKDETGEIVKDLQKEMPYLKILFKEQYGKGWAVKEGMLAATGNYRLFTDADNSTDISQLKDLLNWAEKGYDVVVGSRKISGAKVNNQQSITRVHLGNIFQYIVNKIHHLPIQDTQKNFHPCLQVVVHLDSKITRTKTMIHK